MKKYKKIIQYGALILFGGLILLGKIQIWMVIFFVSLLMSVFFGRFYCGYICPINTVMEVVDRQAEKSKRKRKETPNWSKSPATRVLVLVIFLSLMAFVFISKKKLPVLPLLFGAGVVVTLFYVPNFWHRYLCPYGILFSLFSKKNKKGYAIRESDCINCGICVKVCPADAIEWKDKQKPPKIQTRYCLVCGKCATECPKKAIDFAN